MATFLLKFWEHFSKHFDRNAIVVMPILTKANSMIFHWFFNEIDPGGVVSQIICISLVFLMLFHRNRLPTAQPPFSPFSICFHIEIRQKLIVSSALHDFDVSLVFLMLFHRNFVSGHSHRFPWGSALSEARFWSPGCPGFVVIPMVFHRIEDNLDPGSSSGPNVQFRSFH